MINFIQKNLVYISLIVCASPIGLTYFPTIHGKYPGSYLILISTVLAVIYKNIWKGKKYFIAITFFVLSIIPSIFFNSYITEEQILETFFLIFILLTPLLFANIYQPPSSRSSQLLMDVIMGLPLPIIFCSFFIILFGFSPFVTNESEITTLFLALSLKSSENIMSQIYFGLGNSTSISPGLTILTLYFSFKAVIFLNSKFLKFAFVYFLIAALCFYTNLWFHQRIFLAIIIILVFLGLIFIAVNKKLQPYIIALLPIFLTCTFIIFELDVRSLLWRQVLPHFEAPYVFIGMGIGAFSTFEFQYSNPHNAFILFLVEYGIFGLLTFLASIVTYYSLLNPIKLNSYLKYNGTISRLPLLLFVAYVVSITFNSNLLAYEYWVAVLGTTLPIKLAKDHQ